MRNNIENYMYKLVRSNEEFNYFNINNSVNIKLQ